MFCRRILIYPRGNDDGKDNSVSTFLSLDESTLPLDTRLVVRFTIRVLDQNEPKEDPVEFTGEMIKIKAEFNIILHNKIFRIK